MRKSRVGFASAAAVLSAAMVMIQASPAAADPSTTVSITTTDSGPVGGTAIFSGDIDRPSGDHRESISACDKQADGLRVYAEVGWQVNESTWTYESVEDADGAGNGCKGLVLPNITEGQTVYVKACLKDGANGALRYCGTGTGKA